MSIIITNRSFLSTVKAFEYRLNVLVQMRCTVFATCFFKKLLKSTAPYCKSSAIEKNERCTESISPPDLGFIKTVRLFHMVPFRSTFSHLIHNSLLTFCNCLRELTFSHLIHKSPLKFCNCLRELRETEKQKKQRKKETQK